jgi:hypothetical protein
MDRRISHQNSSEFPEVERICSYALYLNSALDRVGGEQHATVALHPEKGHGAHCIEDWVLSTIRTLPEKKI